MGTITRWVESVERRVRGTESREKRQNDVDTASRDEPPSSLFHCPECKTVYIATDKNTCSTCDETVEQVPSELSETV